MVGMIVIGGSAGAMTAVPALLRALPHPLACPVLVALHRGTRVDPTTSLARQLTRQSQRAVEEATDRSRWSADTVLLAPAGYDTLVGPAGPVLASPRDPTGPVPSLDDAFASAGDGFGADALVIGLSSAGTDGVVGASRVLAAGGRVWTVHPDEAEFPLLARSLAALDGVRALSSAQLAAELRRAGS